MSVYDWPIHQRPAFQIGPFKEDGMVDYHGRIMNIHAPDKEMPATAWKSYVYGHRDARHAAAEIAVQADAEIDSLTAERDAAESYGAATLLDLARVTAERDEARAEVERLQERLEIDHVFVLGEADEMVRKDVPPEERALYPDAIDCRDATIGLQDERIERLTRKARKWKRRANHWEHTARREADTAAALMRKSTARNAAPEHADGDTVAVDLERGHGEYWAGQLGLVGSGSTKPLATDQHPQWPACEVCGEPCIPEWNDGAEYVLGGAYVRTGPHRARHVACDIQRRTLGERDFG